jgi:hypothetical protein
VASVDELPVVEELPRRRRLRPIPLALCDGERQQDRQQPAAT